MNVYNISLDNDFLQEFGKFILNNFDNIENLIVFLPNRRSCNELKRKLFEINKGNTLILPMIKAISDIDYDDFTINSNRYLTNTTKTKYKFLLVRELIEWSSKSSISLFKNISMKQICNLAMELERFLNEIVENEIDIDKLSSIVSDEFTEKWQETLQLLHAFCKHWFNYTKNNNIISAVEYRTDVLKQNTKYLKENKPKNSIIIAGVTTNIKSTNDFIKALSNYDNCHFVFSGFDKTIKDVNLTHPQYLLNKLWKNVLNNKEIKEITNTTSNNLKIMQYSMLPSQLINKWSDKIDIEKPSNIIEIECKNNIEEIQTISTVIQNNKNNIIAVVTTDENFARQVEIDLKNKDISIYNAFGNKYSRKQNIKYLFLILDAIKSNFDCIPLLSLLKHDFTNFGIDKSFYAKYILDLEDRYLREKKTINDFKNKITDKILNICKLDVNCDFKDILKKHIEIAEKIADAEIFNDDNDTNVFLNEILNESCDFLVKDLNEYSHLLDFLISANSYNERYEIHPATTIISPKETRLLNFDLVIIANCNDSNFPINTTANIWLNKSMRKDLGLSDMDEEIGIFAFSWMQLLLQENVYITRAIKYNGLLTMKSRFLIRLETFLECQKIKLNNYKIIKEKEENIIEIEKPNPKPNLEIRPKELYVTDIEKLINNPYDIYAKKILKLSRKIMFNEDRDFIIFGNAVHETINEYVNNYDNIVENKLNYINKIGEKKFNIFFVNKNKRDLFLIRFNELAKWFVEKDEEVRKNGYKVVGETEKYMNIENIKILARIDRIEFNDNHVNICDYKTGNVPTSADVKRGEKPQLVIEAIILKNNGNDVDDLFYWQIKGTGDEEDNKNALIKIIKEQDDISNLLDCHESNLREIIEYFYIQENGYIATSYELSKNESFKSDYRHLSRVDEWGHF